MSGDTRASLYWLSVETSSNGRLAEDFRRQHAAGIPTARAAVNRRNKTMLRMLERRLSAHLLSIGRSLWSHGPPLQSLQAKPKTHN